MRHTRILIVDGELAILKLLRANLEPRGFEVLAASDGAEALQLIESEQPDAVILGIMLPSLDGLEVCRRLREWSQMPIIMLSAKGAAEEKVKCLDLGADDYITKPFDVNELVARIRAVLRRTRMIGTVPTQPYFISDDLKISFVERRATLAGKEVKLTPTEYGLLQELVLNTGRILTHVYLLNKIWGPEYRRETEYLRVFVSRLRKKLEPDSRTPKYIITIAGVGYTFKSTA